MKIFIFPLISAQFLPLWLGSPGLRGCFLGRNADERDREFFIFPLISAHFRSFWPASPASGLGYVPLDPASFLASSPLDSRNVHSAGDNAREVS